MAMERYRGMDMTFWLPETEAALAQVEGRSSWDALSGLMRDFTPRFARRLARSRRWKSSTMKVERTTSAPSRAEVSVRRQTRNR